MRGTEPDIDPDPPQWRHGPPGRSPWARRHPTVAWPAAVVSLALQLPVALWHSFAVRTTEGPLLVAAAIVTSALVAASRKYPRAAVVMVGTVSTAVLILQINPPTALVPFIFAIIIAIQRGARVWAFAMITVATAVPIAGFALAQHPFDVVRGIAILLALVIAATIGEGIRNRTERYRAYQTSAAERRQTEAERERVRIARELHDVLAHSLSSINVQAGVGLHLIESRPDLAAESLASIKESSKSALDEVRSVLGILRAEGGGLDGAPRAPGPDLARLGDLVASMSDVGINVTLTNDLPYVGPGPGADPGPDPDPGPGPGPGADVPLPTQQAIYRIVQESLTNVSRHAHASAAQVELIVRDGSYQVTVTDNGTGSTAKGEKEQPTLGRGILGMRERTELLGGHLEAHHTVGGFLVRATIPASGGKWQASQHAEPSAAAPLQPDQNDSDGRTGGES